MIQLAVSIQEAAQITGVSRSTLYTEIKEKRLPMRKCGNRSLILTTDLNDWIYHLPGAS